MKENESIRLNEITEFNEEIETLMRTQAKIKLFEN